MASRARPPAARLPQRSSDCREHTGLATPASERRAPQQAHIATAAEPRVGDGAIEQLSSDGRVVEFIKDQYRHCKTILAIGAGAALLEKAGIPPEIASGDADPGLLLVSRGSTNVSAAFIAALARHCHFARETEPPRV